MDLLRPIAPSYRAAALAIVASVALHGTAIVGYRASEGDDVTLDAPAYTATLAPGDAGATVVPAPAPGGGHARKARARPKKSEPRPGEALAFLPAAIDTPDLPDPMGESPPLPEMLALAQPLVPIAPPELPAFRPEALPGEVTISYALTSAFADGQAEYTWKRDGDRYEITGTAQAVGFFAVFLEGQVEQSTTGRVTPEGLRPERFTERLGSGPEEGLAFDWNANQVQFRYGDNTRTGILTDSTVDWLSMIFQLAQMPPKGDAMDMRVFTQRRLYQFHLQVVGFEELELPLGRANTLHLRHIGKNPEETVDVWLGANQYYLPVKLRYPVARNRLVVEQTATSVKAR
ncbi:MAG: DUF3108 domain-containing protein [Betaproteobacteria bacterium]|nr:DUF3108 domain-containing protein [Betaproteobacteria bacterium]